ncbi:MAG: ABC transporter substrate-binding protein [Bacteroidales bacterium]
MQPGLIRYLFVLLAFISACRNEKPVSVNQAAPGNKYAVRFRIDTIGQVKKLTVFDPWQGAKDVRQVTWLVPEDMKPPVGIEEGEIIGIPVRKIVCMSTTWLSMISALGCESTVKGVSGSDLVYSESYRAMLEKGEISDVGFEDNLNKELIVRISPDVIINYGIGSESSGYISKVREMGFKTLFFADYLETDPLARAEWIKVFGILLGKEEQADSIFNGIVDSYNELKDRISRSVKGRPTVLLGLPWKDTWYVSPGNSFMSKLIHDAGGEYIWSDKTSEISMPFGIEAVYVRAMKADYWLNISTVSDRNEITAVDKRLSDFPAYKTGNMFNNNLRITSRGGNDYWESGTIVPHLILADLVSILHPDLLPRHELYYYRKVK